MKNQFLIVGLLIATSASAVDLQAADPATLQLKIYKVAFSTSALCTNPVTVFSKTEAEATYSNFLSNPKIAENVDLPDGTYNCVIIEFSDQLRYTTTTADGSYCAANTEYTGDVCRGSTYTLIDGTTGTCSATRGVDNHIAMYISTASTETTGTDGHNAFEPPTNASGDATKGFKLASPFVKAGAKTGRFVVNATGKINGSQDPCDMEPPLFSFQ